jgi:hypothetical protein
MLRLTITSMKNGLVSEPTPFQSLLHLKYEPGDIKVWCRWAKQIDGPIFYEKPTPQTCTFDKTHKDYIVCESVMFLSAKYNIILLRSLKGICP